MEGRRKKKNYKVLKDSFLTLLHNGTLLIHHLAVCFPGEGEGGSVDKNMQSHLPTPLLPTPPPNSCSDDLTLPHTVSAGKTEELNGPILHPHPMGIVVSTQTIGMHAASVTLSHEIPTTDGLAKTLYPQHWV